MPVENGSERERRSIRIVDKGFQYGSLIRVMSATIGITIAAFLVSWFIGRTMYGVKTDPLKGFSGSLVALIGLVGILTSILVIRSTHRIAGPVYRLKKSCERVCEGDLDFSVNFRKRDRFRDLGDGFSAMLEALRNREKGRHDRMDRIKTALKDIEQKVSTIESSDKRKNVAVDTIRNLRKEIEDAEPNNK